MNKWVNMIDIQVETFSSFGNAALELGNHSESGWALAENVACPSDLESSAVDLPTSEEAGW